MKRYKWISAIVTTGLITFLFFATCTHKPFVPVTNGNNNNNNTGGNHDTTKTNPVDTGLCFERDVLPIFISNCTNSGCHDSITKAEGYVLNNYRDIMKRGIVPGNANASRLYQSITGADDPMPPSGTLTAAQITVLAKWINAGAADSGACQTNGCDTNSYTYSGAISLMMQLYCTGCHSIASGPAGNLGDYNTVKIIALNGRLAGDLAHLAGYNAMPKGGAQLSDCQVTQVKKWIAAGAQNN